MSSAETTFLIQRAADGDRGAAEKLFPIVYDELRQIASRVLREGGAQTLQPTALVNEAFLRLVGHDSLDIRNEQHFTRIAARAIRFIFVDHCKAKLAAKRNPGGQRVDLDEQEITGDHSSKQVLAVNEALEVLRAQDGVAAEVAELRYFGGMTVQEVSAVLAISPATVKRRWMVAREFLAEEIEQTG